LHQFFVIGPYDPSFGFLPGTTATPCGSSGDFGFTAYAKHSPLLVFSTECTSLAVAVGAEETQIKEPVVFRVTVYMV